MIKTFRGKMSTGDTQRIRLSTNNGLTGYRIVKFNVMPTKFWNGDYESTFIISKNPLPDVTSPLAPNDTVDFTDPNVIAASIWSSRGAAETYTEDLTVIMDNMTFNQDIYISYYDTKTNDGQNYMVELEQVKLDLSEATVATLKDMRGRE